MMTRVLDYAIVALAVVFAGLQLGWKVLVVGGAVSLLWWRLGWRAPVGLIAALAIGVAVCGPHVNVPAPGVGPGSALAAVPADSVTPTTWAQALLGELGDPASAENVRAIVAWERTEGGHWANSARFNPLNTTQVEAGSSPMNSVGVQAYTSWDEGMAATVTTLQNGRYGGILAALRNGSCAPCVAAAVASSPWGTGAFPT